MTPPITPCHRRRGPPAGYRRARAAAGVRPEPGHGYAGGSAALHAGRPGSGATLLADLHPRLIGAVDRAMSDPEGCLFTCTPALDIRSHQQAQLHTRLFQMWRHGCGRVDDRRWRACGIGQDGAARQPLQATARSLQRRRRHQRHLHLRGRRVPDAIRRAAARAHPRRPDRRLPAHRHSRRHVDQPGSDRRHDRRLSRRRIVFLESGGDNLAASFSPELVDVSIYVVDVAGGDKVPRKGGPASRAAIFSSSTRPIWRHTSAPICR